MRVLAAAIIQESNTFSPNRSTMADFYNHHFMSGDEILSGATENELYGFRQTAAELGMQVVPAISANAISSGMFEAEAFERLKETVLRAVQQAGQPEGVYFALHGAMVAEGCDDVEGELLSLVRSCIGTELPLVVSLDLHANVTRRMAKLANGIVGFRTYPHTDFAETGRRSAHLLHRLIAGQLRPVVAFRKLPMIVPAENSQTSHGPFAALWEEALRGESRGDSLCTSLFPVQPWLDVEELGFAVTVTGESGPRAEREAERLAELVWNKRHEFDVQLFPIEEMLRHVEADPPDGAPYVLSDSADSPGAGSTGDSNAVLKALLARGLQERLSCLLTIVDAPAVDKAIRAGVGRQVELQLGYTLNPNKEHGVPITVSGNVRRIGDGKFALKGGYAKNTEASMGRCVVLEIGRISVLVTEQATFTGDPGMYRSMGLEPAEADIVLVKSANQFRADYASISQRIFILDTPGCSSANLRSLTFRKLPAPFYPFQDHFDWRKTT